MVSALLKQDHRVNPLDLIETLASQRNWPFEREVDDELSIVVAGKWADYHISLNWDDHLEGLHVVSAFDFKVPPMRRDEVTKLMAMINEQMWAGHFDLWAQEGMLMCRACLFLSGGAEANRQQCEALLQVSLEACERYFPAFQFTIWAGKTAAEALEASLLETAGEA